MPHKALVPCLWTSSSSYLAEGKLKSKISASLWADVAREGL